MHHMTSNQRLNPYTLMTHTCELWSAQVQYIVYRYMYMYVHVHSSTTKSYTAHFAMVKTADSPWGGGGGGAAPEVYWE